MQSKAARALQRLRSKLRRRSDTHTSSPDVKKTGSSPLLPPAVISKKLHTTKKKSTSTSEPQAKSLMLGDVIEISSDENDSSMVEDDATFQGRTTHSRVQSAKRSTTPLRTRAYFKRTGESLEVPPSPSSRPRKNKRTVKTRAAEYDGGSEGDDSSEDGMDDLSDSEDPPSVSDFLATLKKTKPEQEDGDQSSDFSAGEYDSDDSFIDDAASVESDDGLVLPSDEEDQVKDEYDAAIREATRTFKSATKSSTGAKGKKPALVNKGKRKASPAAVSDIDQEDVGDEPRRHSSHVRKKVRNEAPLLTGAQTPGPSLTQTSGSTSVQTIATPVTPGTGPTTVHATTPVTPVATPGQPITFATLIANTPGAASRNPGAKYVSRCDSLPDVCGVVLPEELDPVLGSDYADLPKLRSGNILPWTTTRGRPHPTFSGWATMIPNMNATLALEIIRFTEVGKYINPSRLSPTEVHLKEIPGDPPRYLVCRNRQPVYAVTLGAVSRSQLFSRSGVGMKQKSIKIRGHEVEWPRWEGFMGMITGQDPLAAQYGMNSIQMSTKSDFTKKEGQTTPLYTDEWTIDSDDKIYDARDDPSFNFAHHASDIADRLPMWNPADGEIPRESCVAVAYSIALFFSQSSQQWTLGCNIRWVLVLGIPEKRSTV
ncbi:hypothetical protein MD484_g7082, partial [Candolleomyces efflorescens]